MLAAELERAQDGPLWLRRRWGGVLEWLSEREAGWSGPGLVALTDRALVFDGGPRRTTSLGTVRDVRRHHEYVWVGRARAHDWLVRCATPADAERLTARLREAVRLGERGASGAS